MSIACIRRVLEGGYQRGGNHLLLAVVLAEHADDAGGGIYPSIDRLAARMRCTPRHVQRLLRDLEADGVIAGEGSATGGRPGSTRRWRLQLDALSTSTPDVAVTPDGTVTPDTAVAEGRPGGRRPLTVPSPEPSLTVIEPKKAAVVPTAHSPGGQKVTFAVWLDRETSAGGKAIPSSDPIFAYAQSVGLDRDMLLLAWQWFRDRYEDDERGKRKRYIDWRAVFRRSIRECWCRYWAFRAGELARWTTVGEQARRAAECAEAA